MPFPLKTIAILFVGLGLLVPVAHADAPATAPSAGDSPDVAAIRQDSIEWNKQIPTMSLQEVRKLFYAEGEREATYTDFVAHEEWEECKTQAAVRNKWGPDAEAKFAHANGTDTIEDDKVADIKVDGDHAVITWATKDITPTNMIKIEGHWLVDMHAMFPQVIKDDPNGDKNLVPTGKLLKQAAADIAAGKFDDADSFITDFQAKMKALTGGN